MKDTVVLDPVAEFNEDFSIMKSTERFKSIIVRTNYGYLALLFFLMCKRKNNHAEHFGLDDFVPRHWTDQEIMTMYNGLIQTNFRVSDGTAKYVAKGTADGTPDISLLFDLAAILTHALVNNGLPDFPMTGI